MFSITAADHDNNPVKLTEMYRNILTSNGILDPISKVASADPGLIGEGSNSDRRYATVEFENLSLQTINLFCKLPIQGVPGNLNLTREMKAFEKESAFLTTYLDMAKELCKRNGISQAFITDIYPKCYYGDKQAIVMENLKVDKNYELVGKGSSHDYETATFALNTLARHHAISYAVIQDAGGPDKFFRTFPVFKHDGIEVPAWTRMLEPWIQRNLKIHLKLLEMHENLIGIKEAMDILRGILTKKKTVCDLCISTLHTEGDDLLVLNHGDYWHGNMLFLKDAATGKIVQEKAIDFQLVRYNSPVMDMAYYLFISANTEMRQTHIRDLFEVYLSSLTNFSNELGHPIILSLDTLLRLYPKKLHLGLIVSLCTRYGPRAEIFRNKKVTGDRGELTDKLAEEWVANNPEKAEGMANEIASVLMEYKRLTKT